MLKLWHYYQGLKVIVVDVLRLMKGCPSEGVKQVRLEESNNENLNIIKFDVDKYLIL